MTNTASAIEALGKFLQSDEPEVLCLTGEWGVGKTYLWHTLFKNRSDANSIALDRISYVSLFGCNSLDQLKLTTFESSKHVNTTDNDDDVASKVVEAFNVLKEKTKKLRGTATEAPVVGAWVKAASGLFFDAVKKQIVCLDDFERAGDGLNANDILGLVSLLKEQRECKVVLILNDKELREDQRPVFEKYLEKVIDIKLTYAPTVEECSAIAFPENDYVSEHLKTQTRKLGIRNIRVLKKIERFARIMDEIVRDSHENIRLSSIHSSCLFGWSILQPNEAPTLEYLFKNRHPDHIDIAAQLGEENEDKDLRTAIWDEILANYGLTHIDKFDEEIIAGIKHGYFDTGKIQEIITQTEIILDQEEKSSSFHNAWRLFHNHLTDNRDDVVQQLSSSALALIDKISANNFDSTIRLLKDLGADDEVNQLLESFKNNVNGNFEYWSRNDFNSRSVTDPDVIRIMDERATSIVQEIDHEAIIKKVSVESGWSTKDVSALAQLTTEELKALISALTGEELRKAKSFLLLGQSVTNPTEEMKNLAANTMAALKQIASESEINRVRIKWHHNLSPDE